MAGEDERKAIRASAQRAGIRRLVAALDRTLVPPVQEPVCIPAAESNVEACVERYVKLRGDFFAAWTHFYRPSTHCLAELTEELIESDPARASTWRRERALWDWFGDAQGTAVRGLGEWFEGHDAESWGADDLDCVRILVAGLIQEGRRAEASAPAAVLLNNLHDLQDRALVNLQKE